MYATLLISGLYIYSFFNVFVVDSGVVRPDESNEDTFTTAKVEATANPLRLPFKPLYFPQQGKLYNKFC